MTEKRTNSSNRRNVFFSDYQFLVYLVATKKWKMLVARIKFGFYSSKETKSRREDSCVRTGCLGIRKTIFDSFPFLYIKISKKWSLTEIYVSRDSKSFQLLGPHIIFDSNSERLQKKNWKPKTKNFFHRIFIEHDSPSVLHAMVVWNYDMIWHAVMTKLTKNVKMR